MDVEAIIDVLNCVGSFDFDELQLVALDPEVDRVHQAHIGDPKEVRLPLISSEGSELLVSINEKPVRKRQRTP